MGMLTGKGKHKAKAGNHPYTNTSKPENVRKKTVHKLRKQGPLGCEVTGEIEAMGTTRALL